MNAILAMIVAAGACAAILVLVSPCQMRSLADWLNARADAKDWNAKRLAEYKTHREEIRKENDNPQNH